MSRPADRDPVRRPSTASPAERTRRAAVLLALTLLVPGGAQVVAGSRRLGRAALRVTLAVWAVLILALILFLASRATLLNLLAQDGVLLAGGVVLALLGLGWALLWADTLRLIRLHLLAPGARAVTAAATALALLLTGGGLVYGGWMAQAGRDSLGSIFDDGPPVAAAEGRYNILVMGGDAGEGRTGLRPDSMHVASVDAGTGRVTMFSLPRNLQNAPFSTDSPLWQVYPDGFSCGDECILNALYTDVEKNHAELYPDAQHPGAEAMMDAAGGILGLEITGYALMDMAGFAQLIDAMGGVDVVSGGYVSYRGQRPDGEWGNVWWAPGEHHLNGEDALAFARSRKFASDYARIRRQQCMQAAMLEQFTPATVLARFEGILDAGTQIVTTNLPQSQLGTFVDLAERSRGQEMARLTIGPPDFGTTGQGFTADPDYDLVHERVAALLAEGPQARAAAATGTDDADAPAAGADVAGVSPLPLLTVLAEAARSSGEADVDPDDSRTWPAPPAHADGSPFTPEELMQWEDAGDEARLAEVAATNDLCAPGE